jgi:hypothetical protein
MLDESGEAMKVIIKGTPMRLPTEDLQWYRAKTTCAFVCPDGVLRLVTLANWKWLLMKWATDAQGVDRTVAGCWRAAQGWAQSFDAEIAFASLMEDKITSFYRRVFYRADNDNAGATAFSRVSRKARNGAR